MPLIVISLCFVSVWLLFRWVCINPCFHVTYTHLPTCGSAGPRGSRHSLGHPQHSCFPGQSPSLSQLASELNGQLSVRGLLPGQPPSVASCAEQPVNKKLYQCMVEYFISEMCVYHYWESARKLETCIRRRQLKIRATNFTNSSN